MAFEGALSFSVLGTHHHLQVFNMYSILWYVTLDSLKVGTPYRDMTKRLSSVIVIKSRAIVLEAKLVRNL